MRHSTGRKESDTLDADSLDRPTEGCNSDQHHDLPAPCLPSESVRRASSSDHRSVRCPRGPRCDVCVCGGRRTVVLSALSRLRSSGAGPRVRSPVDDICAESRRQVLCVTTRVYHTSFVISNMHRLPVVGPRPSPRSASPASLTFTTHTTRCHTAPPGRSPGTTRNSTHSRYTTHTDSLHDRTYHNFTSTPHRRSASYGTYI